MNKLPPGKWSKNYDACVKCGKTDAKHAGQGMCLRCYSSWRAAKLPEETRIAKDKWYKKFKKQGGLSLLKQKRELLHYDGVREAALKRDNYRCVRCGTGVALTVHHKDGKGRSVPRGKKNNKLSNLETLCRSCHMKEHRSKLFKAKLVRLNYWTPKWKLMACVDCGRSDVPHQKEGRCGKCWWVERKRRLEAGTLVTVPGRGYTGGKWKE